MVTEQKISETCDKVSQISYGKEITLSQIYERNQFSLSQKSSQKKRPRGKLETPPWSQYYYKVIRYRLQISYVIVLRKWNKSQRRADRLLCIISFWVIHRSQQERCSKVRDASDLYTVIIVSNNSVMPVTLLVWRMLDR